MNNIVNSEVETVKLQTPWTLYDISLKPVLDVSILKKNILSTFQKVIMKTDGTITDLVALYTGDTIKVDVLHQEIVDDVPSFLHPSPGSSVLRRMVMLHGGAKNYVYAESIFVFQRLSESIQQKLIETDQPIGLLWKQEKLESYRELLEVKIEKNESIANYFNEPKEIDILSRTYAIYSNNTILGAITEKFPITIFR